MDGKISAQGSLTSAIRTRHSSQNIPPRSVLIEGLKESMSITQHAPWNSNIQQQRVRVRPRDKLSSMKAPLLESAQNDKCDTLLTPRAVPPAQVRARM